MSAMRTQLLHIQRIAYKKNLKRINDSLSPNVYVARYACKYEKNLKGYESVSSKADLIRRIISSDVVYHGDYHSLSQSQQSVFRILREIISKRSVILCLEMFYGEDQKFINQYMHNEITKKEFHKKIEYKKKWGYRWENWKVVIDLCKKNSIQILGINSEHESRKNSLSLRDLYSAKVIGKALIKYPDSLVYVVDGDYHISPDHLPSQVEKLLSVFDIVSKRLIVYQNAENLYWQLADKHLEETDVLKISSDSFCIMNTTPANKLQSYLNWLEFSDDAYYPVQADWIDSPTEIGNTSIPALTNTICHILDIDYPQRAMEHLEVHYGNNLDFMEMVDHSEVLWHLIPHIKMKLKNNEGFLLEYLSNNENSYLIYLPNSSLNIAAEETAHFINCVARGSSPLDLKPFDSFYRSVMTEALGFFGSKLINDKRKVFSRNAIRRFIGSHKDIRTTQEEKKMLHIGHLLLSHRYLELHSNNPKDYMKKFGEIYRQHSSTTTIFSTQLGYMLGNKLYSLVKKGKIPLSLIQSLFIDPMSDKFSSFFIYLDISYRILQRKKKK